MKSNCTKLSMFTFLSAIICMIAHLFTDINILFVASLCLVAVAIGSLIVLLCSSIISNMRYGINTAFIIVTFVASIAAGLLVFVNDSAIDINDFFSLSIEQYVFVVSVLSCVISVIVLLGRYIFATPKKEAASETAPIPATDNEKVE